MTSVPKMSKKEKAAKEAALAEGARELREWAESHGPMLRAEGINMYQAVDIINHSKPGQPLNGVGLLAIAVEKLKTLDHVMEFLREQDVGMHRLSLDDLH